VNRGALQKGYVERCNGKAYAPADFPNFYLGAKEEARRIAANIAA
jgi:hypothetical protein